MRSHVKCAHETTRCHTCLKQWIDTGISSGQLCATCPDTSCRGKFAIAEIRRIDTASAEKLAVRIKEAEPYPHCHAAIEKSGGNYFQWEGAKFVSTKCIIDQVCLLLAK